MNNSLLIKILRTFSKRELREMGKWVQSPAHNQREDVELLYGYLTDNGVLNDEERLCKSTAFPHVYPGEEYDDARMRQSMHFLLKVVEEYLIFQEFTEREARIKISLARVFRKRQQEKAFLKNLKQAQKEQEKQPFRNELYFRNKYLIQQERYRYLSEQKRLAELNLQEVSDALDTTYLADKLRQSCIMLSHQQVYNTNYDFHLTNLMIEYLESKPDMLEIPAIAIYYYTYKTVGRHDRKEENFHHLKATMFGHGHLFPNSEIRDIYLMAINYCIQQLNAGRSDYVKESFDLYRKGLEEKNLIENNILSRWTFRNVVAIGLKLERFDWVFDFIQDYQQYLEKRHRESIVHYSLAKLYFEKGDYRRAMPLLMQVDYDDILMTLNAKTMLLKMYYEEDEWDVLESLLESMRSYIQRKKVMGYHKSNYKNIIRYTKKLLRTNPYERESRTKLVKEIQDANPLTEREWLLRQLRS